MTHNSLSTNLGLIPDFPTSIRAQIRERAVFEAGKHDPQTFDKSTLAPFAIRISPAVWEELSLLAESAWSELKSAEDFLLHRPELWSSLGIPARVRALLAASATARSVRFCRMDFHPTSSGWCVSEINADVPGGFLEAGPVTGIVASHFPGLLPPPDPAAILARSIARAVQTFGTDGCVALVHATSYVDDCQVMQTIGRALAACGVESRLAAPNHISSRLGQHSLTTTGEKIAAILRFFPGEWLANLRHKDRMNWTAHGSLIQSNPISALLLQSKRLPMVLADAGILTPVWSSLLPTVRPIGWRILNAGVRPHDEVLKPAWGRVGEGISLGGVTPPRQEFLADLSARFWPSRWVLQQRFNSLPLGENKIHVCLGVYIIEGKAAGVYARVSAKPLIDAHAQDAAVLIDPSIDNPYATLPLKMAQECGHAIL